MLVLSRKRLEKILITDGLTEITITLCDVRGDKARIGIQAPPNFAIHRPDARVKLPAESHETAHANV